ncbi:MCM DNA helicase complex subunit [Perkinsus olseni]|uniref:DNA replication licensing factor MCM3 n=5 Tax=Perkinsus olseni TaxID=32597 RepID=A0A7J6KUL1_PEROL|nr:MCM DNA helicase complex subunit [Perkinsus olseni]
MADLNGADIQAGMSMNEQELFNAAKRAFREFLTDERESQKYMVQFREILSGERQRFTINLMDLEDWQPGLAKKIIKNPALYMPAFDEGLVEAILHEDATFGKNKSGVFPRVGIDGVFGANHLTPRGLSSEVIGELVCVEGIVTRLGLCRPRLSMSVHYCPATGDMRTKEHKDYTSLTTTTDTGGAVPKEDEEGNRFSWEHGLCLYKDFQRLTMQEMPEQAPTGVLPRSAEVLCTGDMCDRAKPGDRIAVIGVYRPIASFTGGISSGVFQTVIIAIEIKQLQIQTRQPTLNKADIKFMKQIAKRKDTFEVLSRSFAPSIAGRDWEKKGMLLQQLGGAEKNLANGTHLRGDINVLLIGDPSCGKSQLLRFVMNTAPLVISTTGRGSSGVGLTAAVTVDRETGERALEAGAMVLADRGVVCIDEFDKMSVADRVAIHEVMEQQTVTVAKAGIHTSLNARCSVLAAANPLYGNFDGNRTIQENIALPDSLLSRFDLVFVVRDKMSEAEDRKIASQVLAQVQNRVNVATITAAGRDGSKNHTSILEPGLYDKEPLLVGKAAQKGKTSDKNDVYTKYQGQTGDAVTVEFLKKYIMYAKNRPMPQLSEDAIEEVATLYSLLRRESADAAETGTPGLAVTARTLEAVIRLSTAHAKLKLQTNVLKDDVLMAREVIFAARGRDAKDIDEDMEEEEEPTRRPARKRRQSQLDASPPPADKQPAPEPTERVDVQKATRSKRTRVQQAPAEPPAPVAVGGNRIEDLCELVVDVFSAERTQFMNIDDLRDKVNALAEKKKLSVFTTAEFNGGLESLQEDNKVFISSDLVYIV